MSSNIFRAIPAALLAILATAAGAAPDKAQQQQVLAEWHDLQLTAAEWLAEQPNPAMQLAAWLVRLDHAGPADQTIEEQLQALVLQRIDRTSDGLTLFLMAQFCEAAQRVAACHVAKLPERIVAHDSGNVMALLALYRNDPEGLREWLRSGAVQTAHAYWYLLTDLWLSALRSHPAGYPEYPEAVAATMIAMHYTLPAAGKLVETCDADDPDVRTACEQLGRRMHERARTVYSQLLGLQLAERAAAARGDQDTAAAMEAEQKRIKAMHRCAGNHTFLPFGNTSSIELRGLQRHLLGHEFGELEAELQLADRAGADCRTANADAGDGGQKAELETVASWLTRQESVRRQSVGLAFLASDADEWPASVRKAFSKRIAAQIDETVDGPSLFLLATACSLLEMIERCNHAGLADRIHRHDNSNLLSLLTLAGDDRASAVSALKQAESVDDHFPSILGVWREALVHHATNREQERQALARAMGITAAMHFGSDVSISEICRKAAAEAEDPALAAACRRQAERMASGRTLFMKSIGQGLKSTMADAAGDRETVETIQRKRLARQQRLLCITDRIEPELARSIELQQKFLQVFSEKNELAALDALAEELGADCPADGAL